MPLESSNKQQGWQGRGGNAPHMRSILQGGGGTSSMPLWGSDFWGARLQVSFSWRRTGHEHDIDKTEGMLKELTDINGGVHLRALFQIPR